MNYRHAYHAGNFADVLKHAALVAVLLRLRKKETPFAVIDTHAGRGLYELAGPEAQKSGEAGEGVERLLALDRAPGVLGRYVDVVRRFGAGRYPGSPLITAEMLRPQDRLTAVEFQAEEFAGLTRQLTPFGNARAFNGDGYRELTRLLPPPERRGVVLIDPPYEDEEEFVNAAKVVIAAYRRFATGIYLLWYPAKARPLVSATAGELLNAGIRSLIRVELDVGRGATPARVGRDPPMSATGLLAVNPPFGFDAEMHPAIAFLARALARGPGASGAVEILAQR